MQLYAYCYKYINYICDIWCVYIDLAGLLIVVLLWVLFTSCHLCSHSDACRVSGNCVPLSYEHVVSQDTLEWALDGDRPITYQILIIRLVIRRMDLSSGYKS